MNSQRPKAVIVTNIDVFFLTNRKEQAEAMRELGYEVHVLAADTGKAGEIEDLGFTFHQLPVSRFDTSLFGTLKSIYKIHGTFKKIAPSIIHQLGVKPILIGTVAAIGTGAWVFNTYTGLGYLFTINTFKTRILRNALLFFFRLLYKRKKNIAIFQNDTDYGLFRKKKVVVKRAHVIKGCGVDMSNFNLTEPVKKEKLRVLLPGKVLSSKGVYEFVKAARIIKEERWVRDIEFVLCGGLDEGHPFAIGKNEVLEWENYGLVKWLGNQSNMQQVFADADIVVLPSHREGLPKTLLEAGAVGRPIITYDVAGCKDVVQNGYNGYIVPFKDINGLVHCILCLYEDEQLRKSMGRNSYEMVKAHFELSYTVQQNLDLYKNYLVDNI